MPELNKIYAPYHMLQILSEKPGFKAGIAFKPECAEQSRYYVLNVYEDPASAARVKKMLPWVLSPDYVENYQDGSSWVLVFRYFHGTPLKDCLRFCADLSERMELIKKAIIFMVNQLGQLPVAMINCLMRSSYLTYDDGRIRFIYTIQFNEGYPYDIQALMPGMGRFITDCLPEMLRRNTRVRRFVKKCEQKDFDKISELVSEFDSISIRLLKTYGKQANHELFQKYADIMGSYVPEKTKKNPVGIFFLLLLFILVTMAGYVYLIPNNQLFIWENAEIREWLTRLYESVIIWLIDFLS